MASAKVKSKDLPDIPLLRAKSFLCTSMLYPNLKLVSTFKLVLKLTPPPPHSNLVLLGDVYLRCWVQALKPCRVRPPAPAHHHLYKRKEQQQSWSHCTFVNVLWNVSQSVSISDSSKQCPSPPLPQLWLSVVRSPVFLFQWVGMPPIRATLERCVHCY